MKIQASKYLRILSLGLDMKSWIIFGVIFLSGFYLRFYNIEYVFTYAWDQARDAWVVWELINEGKYTLLGPLTGIGHMHLGPIYYYMLVPFYHLSHFDPIGSQYLNMISHVINSFFLLYVSRRIFSSNYLALFIIFIYTFSHNIIKINQIPWNVSLVPGISALIFYSLYRSVKGDYKWIFATWALSGFFFHIHFTAIFLPLINILSLMAVKDKQKAIKYSLLSIPLYLIWFMPIFLYQYKNGGEVNVINTFFNDYYIGLHFRFMLYRLSDILIQFTSVIFIKSLKDFALLIPFLFGLVVFLDREKKQKYLDI